METGLCNYFLDSFHLFGDQLDDDDEKRGRRERNTEKNIETFFLEIYGFVMLADSFS